MLALSPGGLEGFPHTVLRSSANEGPGNAKCPRVCVCQPEAGHCSREPMGNSGGGAAPCPHPRGCPPGPPPHSRSPHGQRALGRQAGHALPSRASLSPPAAGSPRAESRTGNMPGWMRRWVAPTLAGGPWAAAHPPLRGPRVDCGICQETAHPLSLSPTPLRAATNENAAGRPPPRGPPQMCPPLPFTTPARACHDQEGSRGQQV